jgi:predicted SAM-dependent methyltransferase
VSVATTLKQRIGRWLFPKLPITRRLFDELRFEANGMRVRTAYALLPWWRARLARLRRLEGQLVNVACGPHVVPGFLNLDLLPASPHVVAWDCRRSLPLKDDGAAGVRVEHFVEHLDPREELPAFLSDVRRALAPGGVLRVIVPDAERYLAAYMRGGPEPFRELGVSRPWPADLPTRLDFVNHVFHQWHEHRWAYDFETLADRLASAGYSRIERMSFGTSLDPRLAQDRPHHAPYSLYVDAVA